MDPEFFLDINIKKDYQKLIIKKFTMFSISLAKKNKDVNFLIKKSNLSLGFQGSLINPSKIKLSQMKFSSSEMMLMDYKDILNSILLICTPGQMKLS